MGKYKNKYRSESTRAPWWDYGKNGYYFVTICTNNRICYFGNVENGKMILSDIGTIAQNCWMEIPKHFPFVILGEFVIMPDHVHGIVIINKIDDGCNDHGGGGTHIMTHVGTHHGGMHHVGTQDFASLHDASHHDDHHPPLNRFGPQTKNLASIIRGFKIGVTKNARLIDPGFIWQPRFYDRIIRNEKSLYAISRYIRNNPSKWKKAK
jgi:putative transposase